MELNPTNLKIDLTKVLRKQVEEQSELCDVTIKVGHWEKKFHKCVLAISPFFYSVFKNDFLERKTGTVEMKFGSVSNVEATILFLYGKTPLVTLDNAYELIGLAEFLLIPDLKASCIYWLNHINVNTGSCLILLQVLEAYDMNSDKCLDYIEGHLSGVLRTEKSISISAEFVELILADDKYSYVSMDEKLLFLLKWAAHIPERVTNLQTFLKYIVMHDLSTDVLEKINSNKKLCSLAAAYCSVPDNLDNNDVLQPVLILPSVGTSRILLIYSVEKAHWFQLKHKKPSNTDLLSFFPITGAVAASACEIYWCRKDCESMVYLHNIGNDEMHYSTLVDENGHNFVKYDNIFFTHRTLFSIRNNKIEITNDMYHQCYNGKFERKQHQEKLYNEALSLRCLAAMQREQARSKKKTISTSTLYKGQVDFTGKIKMVPVIVILNEVIEKVCASNTTVAMFSLASKKVFVYDTCSCLLVKMELDSYNLGASDCFFMAPKEDGFVIYSDMCFIDISIMNGPNLLLNCKVRVIQLERNPLSWYFVSYNFCDNNWYRFIIKHRPGIEFQTCSHVQLIDETSEESSKWKSLHIPMEFTNRFHTGALKMVSLPKSKLRCPLNCRHCVSK